MGLLQRKSDGTDVISVRVPTAIKAKLVELRQRAHALGFNFNATLAEVLGQAARQIHEELDSEERSFTGERRPARPTARIAG
jgi:hypothetical protein